jgi:hypothetical protein
MRSIVESLPEDWLILVPKSKGVMRRASGFSIRVFPMDLTATFSVGADSHRL